MYSYGHHPKASHRTVNSGPADSVDTPAAAAHCEDVPPQHQRAQRTPIAAPPMFVVARASAIHGGRGALLLPLPERLKVKKARAPPRQQRYIVSTKKVSGKAKKRRAVNSFSYTTAHAETQPTVVYETADDERHNCTPPHTGKVSSTGPITLHTRAHHERHDGCLTQVHELTWGVAALRTTQPLGHVPVAEDIEACEEASWDHAQRA